MKSIYLDYAAATPVDAGVQAVMLPYLSEQFYNPSALYLASKAVAKDVAAARAQVAAQLGARPAEIVFTAGGTEANNLAIHGVMRQYPGGNIVVSAIEHEAVLEPAGRYERRLAPVKPDGSIDMAALETLIDDQTVLVSIMYANNEIGTIQPIKEIAGLIKQKRAARSIAHKSHSELPLFLHTDACQAPNYLDLQVARLGVDLMTLNGGKIYGPKQAGALFVTSRLQLEPLILGGGQERGLRSGTENVAQIVGFANALEMTQALRHDEAPRLESLQKLFFSLIEEKLPSVVINGSRQQRLPNNIHVTFPGQDNERLLMQLDEQGIMCATGSACTASNAEPSHVLKALGLTDAIAQSSLRFTMGRGTTETEIRAVVEQLHRLTSFNR